MVARQFAVLQVVIVVGCNSTEDNDEEQPQQNGTTPNWLTYFARMNLCVQSRAYCNFYYDSFVFG